MKALVLIFYFLLFGCCKQPNAGEPIDASLANILSEFIKENPNNKIYQLIFFNIEGRQFFQLGESDNLFDKEILDGCFMFNNKIICYSSYNNSYVDSLINTSKVHKCYDALKECYEKHENLANYDRVLKAKTYRVISRCKIRIAFSEELKYSTHACDSNVIKNEAINNVLNTYLNKNDFFITYIRFKKFDKKFYFSIGQDIGYDKDFSGLFLRNNRIVVLYSIDESPRNCIDIPYLKPVSYISDYKCIHREFPVFGQKMYKIVNNKKVKKIDHSDRIWIELWFNN